jgi:hypothetical protein
VVQFALVIPSRPLLASEGSGRAAQTPRVLGAAQNARLARFLI